jgi:hypothetical protein
MHEAQQLRIDSLYRNTNDWKKSTDQFNRFFRFADGKGINNTSGFRAKSRQGGSTDIEDCAFCILVTTFGESEWPDVMDRESGRFTYYGDNRSNGLLHETAVGGNRLLRRAFDMLHRQQRDKVPPFLCFESTRRGTGMYMRFLGLAAPGAQNMSPLEDLVAAWRVKGEDRFQNYRAIFTVLREDEVRKEWLDDLVNGVPPADSSRCPATWARWVRSGRYTALECERKREPRSRKEQEPRSAEERALLARIYNELTAREFEFAAAEIVQLMDERFVELQVTRGTQDGGRDVTAIYRVGHPHHQVNLSASIEAKQWNPASAVGVKPMMRLISRLKHRDIGVFVTTSFFDGQVQEELIEDRHPVILLSGGDVARLLISRDYGSHRRLESWIESLKRQCFEAEGGRAGPVEKSAMQETHVMTSMRERNDGNSD